MTLPTAAPAGADLVCGIDRDSLAAATGFEVGRAEGELTVIDGVGSGECVVEAAEGEYISDPLAWVSFDGPSSSEWAQDRATLDGDPTVEAPDVVFDGVEGFVSGDVEPERRDTLGASASVFFGDTLVGVTTSRGDVGRDPAVDMLALTLQVAATYGLGNSTPTP